MKKIKKGELYRHLSEFLQQKGIELHQGSYTGRIQQGCRILSDAINATQTTVDRAKKGMDRGLQEMRRVLRKKSAASAGPARGAKAKGPSAQAAPKTARAKVPKRKAARRKAV